MGPNDLTSHENFFGFFLTELTLPSCSFVCVWVCVCLCVCIYMYIKVYCKILRPNIYTDTAGEHCFFSYVDSRKTSALTWMHFDLYVHPQESPRIHCSFYVGSLDDVGLSTP